MKFVSKLMLYLAFTGLIPNLVSAYSIKEAKEQVKSGRDKAVNWIKQNPKKVAISLALTGFGLYSYASYLHIYTKFKANKKISALENCDFPLICLAALLLPVKETVSICVSKQNPVKVAMKNFIKQTLLGLEKIKK